MYTNMGGGGNQDLAAMKKLVTSWQVVILYDVFKEEDITINELKIMEFRHINSILQNYKMGVRIRFEHHFNNWRNKIGLPLKTNLCCCHYKSNHYNEHNRFIECYNIENTISNTTNKDLNNSTKRKRHKQDVSVNLTHLDESQPILSPQSVKSENSMGKIVNSEEMIEFPPAPVVRSDYLQIQSNNTEDEGELDNLNILADLISTSVNDSPLKFQKQIFERCPVNLAQILQSSGTRALSIVNFYKKKKHLTNIHRNKLLQIIVDFFDENDYHLSLNMSHNLEWEILKMFPTEKLENYRTEKRGKIYAKFSNMKRFKRERNNKVNSEIECITRRTRHSNCNDDNDQSTDEIALPLGTTNFEGWPVVTESEVIVKEELPVEKE